MQGGDPELLESSSQKQKVHKNSQKKQTEQELTNKRKFWVGCQETRNYNI